MIWQVRTCQGPRLLNSWQSRPRAASGRRQADAGAGPFSPPNLVLAWLPALPWRNLWEEHLKKFTRVRGAQEKFCSCMPRQLNAGVLQWDEAHPSLQWRSITWFVVAFLYIFSPARGWRFESGPGVPTYFTHTHTHMRSGFLAQGIQVPLKICQVQWYEGNPVKPSLSTVTILRQGAPESYMTMGNNHLFRCNSHWKQWFSIVMLVFRGVIYTYYIPRAHTHILTHVGQPPKPGAGTMEPGPMSSTMTRQRTVPWCFVKCWSKNRGGWRWHDDVVK